MAACALLAHAQPKSDWEREQEEREWREREVKVPAYPKPEDLIEFDAGATTDFRFYIDRGSLSVGKDGVVRFALVARSAAGAENVSFEGIRCRSGTYRIYAYGRADRTWTERASDWRPIEPRGYQRWRNILWREYFCPHQIPVHDADEAIAALRAQRR